MYITIELIINLDIRHVEDPKTSDKFSSIEMFIYKTNQLETF